MKVLAITNRKGGVGKSTMATHLSAGLATLGFRVGLVDTDSQGHCALMLGMLEENGLFNVLVEKQSLTEAVRLVPAEHYSVADQPSRGALYLLPSGDRTFKIPYELSEDESFTFLETTEAMAEQFALDVVVVDTNPTMNKLDGVIYLAVDGHIYVTECEQLSFDGIQKAIEQLKRFAVQRQRYLHRDTRVLGIVPNKFDQRTHLHRYNIAQLAEAYPGLVLPPVIKRIAWAAATQAHELIYTFAPGGQEAHDAWQFVDWTRRILEAWVAETSSAQR